MPLLYENVFGKSPEVKLAAEKKPTKMSVSLWNETETERMENKTVFVGTTIKVSTGLHTTPWFTGLDGKRHMIFHRLDAGTWEKIADVSDPKDPYGNPTNYITVAYTLKKAGTHSFYSEFPGDDEYEGCGKLVKTFARRA